MNGVMQPDLWYSLPVLTGNKVRLEPLALEHAAGYRAAAATGSPEVFNLLSTPSGPLAAPSTPAEAIRHIAAALAERARGQRLPYAQLDARTAEVTGTTSFFDVDPAARSIAIGHSWQGEGWRSTGQNTEARLLMLTYAFDALGTVRVFWQVDSTDGPAHRSLEGLGAQREGVLRKHRPCRDGSWADTAQYSLTDEDWPRVRAVLTQRLARP